MPTLPDPDNRPTHGEGGKEPLATLARYRRRGDEVVFGQNCVHRGLDSIRVGDRVEVMHP